MNDDFKLSKRQEAAMGWILIAGLAVAVLLALIALGQLVF